MTELSKLQMSLVYWFYNYVTKIDKRKIIFGAKMDF